MSIEILTRKEVAQMLAVDPLTIREWERQGKIAPVFYVANKPRYSLESVQSLISNRIQNSKEVKQ